MSIKIINIINLELKKLQKDCLNQGITINQIFPNLSKILIGFYSKKNRFYHNLTHVISVVKHCRKHAKDKENLLELILAAWFHDIIYCPISKNNEAMSAKIFERIFLQTNMPKTMINKIKQYILSTKNHLQNVNSESAILIDADLKILASTKQVYLEYSQNIQKEYSFFTDKERKEKRKKFLENFLNAINSNNGKVYNFLSESHNQRAIKNIKNELKGLSQTPKHLNITY